MVRLTVKTLRSLAQKSKGLIGAKEIYPVFFTTRWGIHTLGVLQPIDVLVLDTDDRVVAMSNKLPPNRIFFWNPKYFRVVELPAGWIEKKKIIRGTRIMICYLHEK